MRKIGIGQKQIFLSPLQGIRPTEKKKQTTKKQNSKLHRKTQINEIRPVKGGLLPDLQEWSGITVI